MYPNYYAAQHVYEEQMKDERRELAKWRLLRDSSSLERGRVAQAACWLVCGLGGALIRAGQALQRQVNPDAVFSGGSHAPLAS